MRNERRRLALAASIFLCACSSGPHLSTDDFVAVVRQRASLEFPCAPEDIEVVPLGGLAFRAVGCGAHATYECTEEHVSGDVYAACVRAVRDDPVRADAGSD